MTQMVINTNKTFGAMAAALASEYLDFKNKVQRLQAEIGMAAAAYGGTAGTEYEGDTNNFGVVASTTPGQQGTSFAFQVGTISTALTTFDNAIKDCISVLDQGI